jgi:cobalt-zinc-cadmium efflux system membrane fusion protein
MKSFFKQKMTSAMSYSFWNSLLVGTLLLGVTACHHVEPPPPKASAFVMSDQMLATTQMATALLEPVKSELAFYGKITADNNKLIEIFPLVGGNVTKVYVELGDYVQKGQLLATIRSTEVAGFEKDAEDAKSDLAVARNNYKVAQELYAGKLNTDREVLEAKSLLEKAQSQSQRVRTTSSVYNIKPGAIYEVRSPLSGFIIEKDINQDMQLRSDKSDNLFDVAEINDVWALANISETEIGKVHLGDNATVTTLSYPDRKFMGKVDKIYNIIDPDTKAMKARVKLANPDFLLKPEMRATVQLSYTENQEMVSVPAEAIIFDKEKNQVVLFRSKNDLEVREVQVFRQVGNRTYIRQGLQAGDKVLTANSLFIYNALTN